MALFCLINVLILILLSILFSNLSIAGVGIVGFLIVLYICRDNKQRIYNSLSIIFCVSVIFMLIMYYGYISKYGSSYYHGGSDDLLFEAYGEYVIDSGYYIPEQFLDEPQFRYYSANGFVWIISWIMRISNILGGYHTVAYRVLNIYFLMSLGILIFKYFIKHYDFSRKQNLTVLYAFTLFPNCQYISTHVFRDTLNILVLFAIFYIWDNYTDNKRRKHLLAITIIATAILTYISYWLRAQNLVFITAIIILNVFLNDKKLTAKNIWLFAFAAIAGIAFYFFSDVASNLEYFTKHYSDYILDFTGGLSRIIFSMSLFPFGIILRLAYGLVSPLPIAILQFPEMLGDIDIFFNVLISLGVIGQIYLLQYLFYNIRCIDKVTLAFLIFFTGTVITTFTFRHFILSYPFMAILIFRMFFKTSKKTKYISSMFMTGFLSLGVCIYLLIK